LREALDAFVDSTQANVTGEVKVRLHKGRLDVMSRKSRYSLYEEKVASFTMGADYNQKDAEGFINLVGLPIRVHAAVTREANKK
jgi:argininosuccinate synthase